MLKKLGTGVLKLLVILELLNVSFDIGVVTMDWRGACIVVPLLIKGTGDKCKCRN